MQQRSLILQIKYKYQVRFFLQKTKQYGSFCELITMSIQESNSVQGSLVTWLSDHKKVVTLDCLTTRTRTPLAKNLVQVYRYIDVPLTIGKSQHTHTFKLDLQEQRGYETDTHIDVQYNQQGELSRISSPHFPIGEIRSHKDDLTKAYFCYYMNENSPAEIVTIPIHPDRLLDIVKHLIETNVDSKIMNELKDRLVSVGAQQQGLPVQEDLSQILQQDRINPIPSFTSTNPNNQVDFRQTIRYSLMRESLPTPIKQPPNQSTEVAQTPKAQPTSEKPENKQKGYYTPEQKSQGVFQIASSNAFNNKTHLIVATPSVESRSGRVSQMEIRYKKGSSESKQTKQPPNKCSKCSIF